jgi:Flp pilus assembly protein TadD
VGAVTRLLNDLLTKTSLAYALWSDGQPKTGLDLLRDIKDDLPEVLRVRGEIRADLDEEDAALALADLHRARHHQRPSTFAARALALARKGRFDAAEQEAADALADAEDDGVVLVRVARVRLLNGDLTDAAVLASVALTTTALPAHLREAAHRVQEEVRRAG